MVGIRCCDDAKESNKNTIMLFKSSGQFVFSSIDLNANGG